MQGMGDDFSIGVIGGSGTFFGGLGLERGLEVFVVWEAEYLDLELAYEEFFYLIVCRFELD